MSTDSKSDLPRDPAREPDGAPVYDDATQRTGVPVPSLNAEGARREAAPDGSSASSAAAMGLVEQATVISKRPTSGGESSSTKPPLPAASPAELGKALEGTTLGPFQLQEFVGGGGMGAVFRALDTMLGRTVAVKVLFRDRTDLETLRRFQNEGQSAAQLDHQNIARVYHVGEDKGLHYIVFEFIEGINLRDLVQQHGRLPVAEAVGYTLQVAEALEHAAARRVVHRDIKPSNVLVTADGRAKLVDMGLARLHKLESMAEDLTASGVTLGTFDYISPEQARDPRVADVRSDLYSLGCTLYFMLTGRPPFPEGTVLQKLLSHSGEEPVDPRQFRPELDEGIVAILRKLLAKQPGQRHQEPNELIGELLLLAERLDLSGVSRIGTYWIASRRNVWDAFERQLPWVLPVAALLAVIFVLLVRPAHDAARPPPPPRLQVQSSAPKGLRQTPVAPAESKPDAAQTRAEDSPVPPAAETPQPATGPAEMLPAAPPGKPAPDPVAPGPTLAADPKTDVAPDGKTDAKTDTKSDAATGAKPGAKADVPKPGTPPAELPGAADERAVLKPQPASLSGEATTAPGAPTTAAAAEYLIVGPLESPSPANAKVFDSLNAACQEAARSGVETIELHFDGLRQESPVTLAAPRLNVRAGPGHRPTVLFRPSRQEWANQPHLIRVLGGRLNWAGVHVKLELPDGPADGGSLFQLQQVVSLEMQNAVVTVRNLGSGGELSQRPLAFFEMGPSRSSPSGADRDRPADAVSPYVRIERCVVRGQAVLFRAPQAAPFRVVCHQSLLVTSERLLEVNGAPHPPGPKADPLEIDLKNVTAVMRQGLCRLASDATCPYQLDLVARCINSILYVTDAAAPVLERKGAATLEDVTKRWTVSGRDNFYPGSTVLLRIAPAAATEAVQDFDLAARDKLEFDEKSPRTRLIWATLPAPSRSADLHTPGDYLLDESQVNPAIDLDGQTRAGVNPAMLPPLGDDKTVAHKPVAPPVAVR